MSGPAVFAKDVMSTDVPTVRKDASVAQAVRMLAEIMHQCVVVVDDEGRPEGIITERDLLPLAQGQGGFADLLVRLLEEDHNVFDSLHNLRKSAPDDIGDIVSGPVRSAKPDATLAELAGLLERFDVGQIPIVENDELVGRVTRQDIIRAIAKQS